MKPIILASRSPRRQELLLGLGWKFTIADPGIDEQNGAGEAPRQLCRRLALEKAKAVSVKFPESSVIGADTIVVLEGKVLGKPANLQESSEMIKALSGKKHEVMTGVAVCLGEHCAVELETTRVFFRTLDLAEIESYVATGEGLDKAGAYAIQGKGALLVSGLEGCYFNVVVLPLPRLSFMLEGFGLTLSSQWGEEE